MQARTMTRRSLLASVAAVPAAPIAAALPQVPAPRRKPKRTWYWITVRDADGWQKSCHCVPTIMKRYEVRPVKRGDRITVDHPRLGKLHYTFRGKRGTACFVDYPDFPHISGWEGALPC